MSDTDQPQSEAGPSITVIRSPDYRTITSDIFRSRVGGGECTIIFSKIGHTPNLNTDANRLEEQIEIVMSWSNFKILAMHLSSLTAAIEAVHGPIPVPAPLMASRVNHFFEHVNIVRGNLLVPIAAFTPEGLF